MRVGTPGFQPERLIKAREARGIFSREELSRRIGKSAMTVQRWEEGRASPEADTLTRLAEELRVRAEYFLRPAHDGGQPVFFRSLASTLKKDIRFQKARISWLQDMAAAIQSYVEFPQVDIPNVLGKTTYRQLRHEDLERIADDLRAHWRIGRGPIPNVLEVMEQAGVVIGSEMMKTTKLDGLNQWATGDDSRPYVLLAEDKMSFVRRQMDAAHELAHCVLHRHVTDDQLRDDFKLIEAQAFRLGGALLMPSVEYASDLTAPTLNAMLLLKDKWKVSIKAQIRRVQDLKILDADDATFLYKAYSARGWSSGEPYDDQWVAAKPRMLAEALNAIVDAQLRTKGELINSDFAVPAEDVESLCGLPKGWFGSGQPKIVKLIPRGGDGAARSKPGDVLLFPGFDKIDD